MKHFIIIVLSLIFLTFLYNNLQCQIDKPFIKIKNIELNKYSHIIPGDTIELNVEFTALFDFPCYVGYVFCEEIFQPLDSLDYNSNDSTYKREIINFDSGSTYQKSYKLLIKKWLNFGGATLEFLVIPEQHYQGYAIIHYNSYYLLFNDSLDGYFDYTDVKDVSDKNPLNAEIVPNPIVNYGNLQLNLPKDCKLTIKIVDILGNEYYNINQQYLQGSNSIPLPTLNTGTYIANIYYDNKFISKKFVVLR